MTFDFGGRKVRQITKQTAKKNYYAGKTIFVLPCNMKVNNFWMSPCPINKNEDVYDSSFDTQLANYVYYNCDKERGKYPIFFAEV